MTDTKRASRPIARWLAIAPAAIALAACVSPRLQTGVVKPDPRGPGPAAREGLPAPDAPAPRATVEILDRPDQQPTLTARAPATSPKITLEEIEALVPDQRISAAVPPQTLPQFIDTVFGQVLQVPYVMGPGVAERREQVALRGPTVASKRAFFTMAQMALEDYGVVVTIEQGVVRITRDDVATNRSPLFVRSRVGPDTPEASRPVVQFFELKSIDVNSLVDLLKGSFPDINRVKFTARQDINTLVIAGTARDVANAAELIEQIDQPRFAQAHVARVEPVFWSADKLTDIVIQTLGTEGYQATKGAASIQRAVTFMPVPFTNEIFVFSNQKDVFDRALHWIDQLDRPAALGDQESVFVYTVRNTGAAELGKLVAAVTNGAAPPGAAANSADAARATNGEALQRTRNGGGPLALGRITVDALGNRLLYRGTPSEFQRTRELLDELDVPPQQVLVELTIAEVTLTDETRMGVEWFIRESVEKGILSGGTLDGLGLAGEGLSMVFSKSDVQVALNAFASNSNVNILSTPRLVARSGGEAEIQVGTDVPIITSQRAATTQVGGDSDILQTVQYRQTGVILRMNPIVYGDRVDIEIFQEVSSQQSNPNAAIGSPLILNRSVSTQLSLQEGMTGVIGGLIQDNYSRGATGVPILKDLPLVGGAFRSDTVSGGKTELLILVTPYILRTSEQAAQAASNYSASLNRQLRRRGPHAYTLLPWSTGLRPTRVHGGANAIAPPRRRGGGPDPVGTSPSASPGGDRVGDRTGTLDPSDMQPKPLQSGLDAVGAELPASSDTASSAPPPPTTNAPASSPTVAPPTIAAPTSESEPSQSPTERSTAVSPVVFIPEEEIPQGAGLLAFQNGATAMELISTGAGLHGAYLQPLTGEGVLEARLTRERAPGGSLVQLSSANMPVSRSRRGPF